MKQYLQWLWPLFLLLACQEQTDPLHFESANTSKPWTYWWWMGSAVTKSDITDQLIDYQKAGLGGVHIIPIYGVRGEEENFLPYLSEGWKDAVKHTIRTADSLGMGVDLTLGTGWPFGGPMVSEAQAARKVALFSYDFPQADQLIFRTDSILQQHKLRAIEAVVAVNEKGEQVTIPHFTEQEEIRQPVERADWTLLVLGHSLTGQQVKRAAPGGEGLVMDYFDATAVESYLYHHDSALADLMTEAPPRSFYHDSYEAYGANWSADFQEKFERLRGYPLADILVVLQDTSQVLHGRALHDIRETLSDLLYENFTRLWTDWSRDQGKLTRNQAHGSPANILDLYALAAVPETESFGTSKFNIPGLRIDEDFEEERFGRPSPLMMKFASSPAHLMGKPLVSSETATWLGNHFKVSLSQVKPQIDELFTAGINHVFFHGMAYSPESAGFPGWLFYASTNFGRSSHFWDELPQLTSYISQCQRYLQNTAPDNDLLLYFPIHDLWTKKEGNWLLQLDVHHYEDWFSDSPVGALAEQLWNQGYTFDYLSDRQLALLEHENGTVALEDGARYQSILVPPVDYLPLESLERLHQLAEAGVSIIFMEHLPTSVSGYLAEQKQEDSLQHINALLKEIEHVRVLDGFEALEQQSDLRQEDMRQQGLSFIRKRHEQGYLYFISNLSHQFSEGLIRLAVESEAVEILEPISGKRGQVDQTLIDGQTQIYLQLPPGASCFVFTYDEPLSSEELYLYTAPKGQVPLSEGWEVNFVSGNTENLAANYSIDSLTSWTTWPDSSLQYFSGKAKYNTHFTLPEDQDSVEAYRLQFTDLRESAQVILNGQEVGTVWALPYEIILPKELMQQENTLELIVQNLSANRMIQVDRQEENWKKFYDINIVDITYQSFDASDWKPVEAGVIGPVKLQTIQYFH